MKKYIYNIIGIAVSLLLACSCVHQWPENAPADLTLKLNFERTIPPFDTIEVDTKASEAAMLDARYTVEIYRQKGDGDYNRDAIIREVFTRDDLTDLDCELKVTVPAEGTYKVTVWTDYVDQGTVKNKYYDNADFKAITIHQHEGNTVFREAFVGHLEVDVVRFGAKDTPITDTVYMYRPQAKVEFITTDLAEFIEKEIKAMQNSSGTGTDKPSKVPQSFDFNNYVVKIYYTGYMPYEFDTWRDRPVDTKTGFSFDSGIVQKNTDEALLGHDLVLVSDEEETSVMMAVGLYDQNGKELSRTNPIEVPLRRGMLTTVKGRFMMQDSNGGIAIDPGFIGDYVVQL